MRQVRRRINPIVYACWAVLLVAAAGRDSVLQATAALPTGWMGAEIGTGAIAGSGSALGGQFTVEGSGTDIGGTADQAYYVHRPLSGDGEIVARVTSVQPTSSLAKAGLMIRESLAPGSRHVSIVVTPARGIVFLQRQNTGGATGAGYASGAAPYWVKLVRKGNTFSAYRSSDGSSWALSGQLPVTMAQSVYVGLAVTSNNNTVATTATFDNVQLAGGGGSAVAVSSVALNPAEVGGGASSTGTIALSAAAPAGGATISLVSSHPSIATVPQSLTVPAGSLSATVSVATAAVAASSPVTITASYGGITKSATLTVLATAPSGTLSALTVAPTSVRGGNPVSATVTVSAAPPSPPTNVRILGTLESAVAAPSSSLTASAAGDATIGLTSSHPAIASVPATVTVPAGTTSATFFINTTAVTTSSLVTITASYGGITKSAPLTVLPPSTSVTLSALTLTPSSVQGATTVAGNLTLSAAAPSGGAVVALSSSQSSAAAVPTTVTVPVGSTTASFSIATSQVTSSTSVTIAGAYGGVTKAALLTVLPATLSSHRYVAPNGSASGDGTLSRPWDLATALSHPSTVKPGDTIWLRGGTYRGNFRSDLTGTASAPIVVRQYPGERATLDANTTNRGEPGLRVFGADTWYWGFEITDSNPNRMNSGGFNNPPLRATSVYVVGPRTKFINLVVHDGLEGFDFWSPAVDAEIYGTLIYNVGVEAVDRGHGHSIYVQNQTGTKRIVDNILFNGFSFGIHAYTGSNFLDNIYMEGNVAFNHGILSAAGAKANIYFGGGDVPNNPSLVSNFVYSTPGNDGRAADLDNAGGCTNLVVSNNYLVGDSALEIAGCTVTTLSGNTLYGDVGSLRTLYPANTYHTSRPTGVRTFVRPNRYERGRAHIVVFNWDQSGTVAADVSSVLQVGARYEVRNAQDFFAAPVLTGTYDGTPLQLRMTGLTVAKPTGLGSAPAPTGPDFNVFVLITQ